jgi:hypothetical protein
MIWLADFHVTEADRTMLTPSTLPTSPVNPMEEIGERRSFWGKEQRQIPGMVRVVRNDVGAVVVVSEGEARLFRERSDLHSRAAGIAHSPGRRSRAAQA